MEKVDEKILLRSKYKLIRQKNSQQEKDNVRKNVERYLNEFLLNKKHLKYIGIYWPIQNEVDLRILKYKYHLALPKCQPQKKLKFHAWDESPLKNDYESIPYPDNNNLLSHSQLSMIFIPCLSIDKKFNRLGYGGGYFDRLRANKNWSKIPAIGILTSSCISNDLLTSSEFDIPLSGYITEKEIVI